MIRVRLKKYLIFGIDELRDLCVICGGGGGGAADTIAVLVAPKDYEATIAQRLGDYGIKRIVFSDPQIYQQWCDAQALRQLQRKQRYMPDYAESDH